MQGKPQYRPGILSHLNNVSNQILDGFRVFVYQPIPAQLSYKVLLCYKDFSGLKVDTEHFRADECATTARITTSPASSLHVHG